MRTEHRYECPRCGHVVVVVVRASAVAHLCPMNRMKPVECKEVVTT